MVAVGSILLLCIWNIASETGEFKIYLHLNLKLRHPARVLDKMPELASHKVSTISEIILTLA